MGPWDLADWWKPQKCAPKSAWSSAILTTAGCPQAWAPSSPPSPPSPPLLTRRTGPRTSCSMATPWPAAGRPRVAGTSSEVIASSLAVQRDTSTAVGTWQISHWPAWSPTSLPAALTALRNSSYKGGHLSAGTPTLASCLVPVNLYHVFFSLCHFFLLFLHLDFSYFYFRWTLPALW